LEIVFQIPGLLATGGRVAVIASIKAVEDQR
jgi:hypothetical protein